MPDEGDTSLESRDWPEIVRRIRARTPARILVGRAGAAYRTRTQLELREAHAAASDAVRAELDLQTTFDADFVNKWGLFEVRTEAARRDAFLLQPELGRHFSDASRTELATRCSRGNDLQLAIGDGLSVPAVAAQVPALFSLIQAGARERGWTVGQGFVIRHCRVGILNEIGELFGAKAVVLLIGERPGLATAESLSAYMAYRPQRTHSDAERNLISNIHARGTKPEDAAIRILNLVAQMIQAGASGYRVREAPPVLLGEEPLFEP
jgi:ethanolamine ammonia-lyase small subunit